MVLCDVQLPGGDGLTLLNRSLQVRPETLFIMITAYATVENAVAAFQRGAHDYLMKPVMFEELLAKIDRLMKYRRLLLENQALRRQFHAHEDLETLVGRSPAMQAVKTLIRKVGPTRSTVLITGESGTGKELVARALHACGPDPDAVFLAVNCAAIPHDLLENQLFGHVRGAFTGADRDHAGLFVAAGRGTVFLDEIGELARSTQAKLLRAIENKEVLPIGATRPVSFQARLVTATNKDLLAEVAAGRFREDLYYRLNVVSIHLPPLRDRREDIPELVSVLLAKHAARLGKHVAGRRQRHGPRAHGRRLEGQRPRAGQRPRTCRHPGRRTDPDPRRFSARPDAGSRLRKRNDARQPPRGRPRVRAAAHPARAQATAATTSARPPAGSAWASRRSIASSRSSTLDQAL